MRSALLERRPQRRPSAEQVLLADELAQRCRSHARGQRLAGDVARVGPRRGVLGLEQLLFHDDEFSQR